MRGPHVITRLIIGGTPKNTVATVLGSKQRPATETDLRTDPMTGTEGFLRIHFPDMQ